MKKILLFILLLAPLTANAQFSSKKLAGLGMSPELASYFQNNGIKYTGNQGLIVAPTAIAFGAAAEGTPAAKVTPYAKIDTQGVTFSSSTAGIQYPAAVVITPSTSFPTPAAGDTLTNRLTILAAGAPTAAFVELPRATASVGKTYQVFNQGSNPLAIVPQSGDTQGVAAAATPFFCTTLKTCDCTGITTSGFQCGLK